jgi:hypothetical protein
MSRYTVDWDPEAEDDLARAWMRASDPSAVTRAQVEADRLLAQDPIGNGRHLSEGLYRMEVPPLIVSYTVDTVRQHAQVTSVALLPGS